MTEATQEQEPEATSTMDIITELAVGIAALSDVIGKLEFIEGDAEEDEENPLGDEDKQFLATANEAVETAIREIGYGNDVSRIQVIGAMKALMDQYAGEEHLCEDCRRGMH